MGKGSARGAHGSYDGIVTIVLMPAFCGELAFILSNFLVWGLSSSATKDLCSGPAKYILGMGCIWLFAVCAHCCLIYSDACRGGERFATLGLVTGGCSVLALLAMSAAGAVLLAGNDTCRDAGEGVWAMALADVVIHFGLLLLPMCVMSKELLREVCKCCGRLVSCVCSEACCCCGESSRQTPAYNNHHNPVIRHNVNLIGDDDGPPQWHRDVSLDLPPSRRNPQPNANANANNRNAGRGGARAGPPGNVLSRPHSDGGVQLNAPDQAQAAPAVAPDAPPLSVMVDGGDGAAPAAAAADERNAGPPGGMPVERPVPTEAPVFLDPAGLGKALTDDSVAVHVTVRIPNRAKYPVYQLNLPKSWSVGSCALAILERLEVSAQYSYKLLDTAGDELDERLEVSALADEQRIARLLMRYR